MTCNCSSSSSGLGFTAGDADAAITALGDAIQTAKNLWNELEATLGIGAGRREADVIVPVQNKLWNEWYVPASNMVQVGEIENHSCAELQSMLSYLHKASDRFAGWLNATAWQDGRAAQQALCWLTGAYGQPCPPAGQLPYASMVMHDVTHDVNSKCGGILGGGITIGGTTISTPVLILGGVAAYYAFFKKGR